MRFYITELSMLSRKTKQDAGFALIATISVMVLLVMIALAMLSLSTLELRSTSKDEELSTARANARMGLMLAIGELQKSAGSDQRITATADVLTGSSTIADGRGHWMGVWDTSNYDQSEPNTKPFVRWLVSSGDPAVTTTLASTSSASGSDDLLIFKGDDDASSVQVPKVIVDGGTYAYWVEDEGVKADLGWHEGEFTEDHREQSARLTSTPGVDHEVFEGPFSGKVSYPIKLGGANGWLDQIEKANSPVSMPLVMDDATHHSEWLRSHRHNMTFGSRGVMADVKKGGLRRDLSLAFEMDGDADFSKNGTTFVNPPTKFNQQYGEFVGETPGSDALTAEFGVEGLIARYVYGDALDAGFPFSGDVQSSEAVLRGPTWWALRDYANSYKRLRGNVGNYTLSARAYFPNHGALVDNPPAPVQPQVGTLADVASAHNLSDKNIITGGIGNVFYVEKPFEANYTPVLLGYTSLLSILSAPGSSPTTEKLALGLDPVFYLWNPYNHRLKADRFAISFRAGLPGQIKIWLNGVGRKANYVQDYVSRSAGLGNKNTGFWLSYSIANVDLAPGEVKIYSPPVDATKVSSNSRHPYNTDAFEGAELDAGSGALITKFPAVSGNAWGEILLSDFTSISVGFAMTNTSAGNQITTSLPPLTTANRNLSHKSNFKFWSQSFIPQFGYSPSMTQIDHFQPAKTMGGMVETDAAGPYTSASIGGSKQFCGVFSLLSAPSNFSGPNPNPVENFAQFNPLAVGSIGKSGTRVAAWNQEAVAINKDFSTNYAAALEATGVVLPALPGLLTNGYWGANYGDPSGVSGSTAVPMLNIPSEPIISLAQFAHANLSIRAEEPLNAVGNSWASVFVDPVSPYGQLAEDFGGGPITASDMPWLINDALFDRYYLSGIASDFTINGSGYSANGTMEDTLEKFFGVSGADFRTARANPVLQPYLPTGVSAEDAVAALFADDGYRKMGAYSLINGVFNVNSTSVTAWKAFLRANRGLAVTYAQGGNDSGSASTTPFPRGTSPVSTAQSDPLWSGLSRLEDSQIDDLAEKIVEQVKLRGPFMSLSDFVNHRVGRPKNNATHYMGALQAAIEDSGINSDVHAGAGGTTVNYAASSLNGSFSNPISGNRPTTTGITTAITQADLLLSLAPRLTARSDTFRIRAYGEARSADGSKVLAQAMCEAVVQRIPEYVDTLTDADNNEPWDEASAPNNSSAATLNPLNQKFGRRFTILQFRWLNQNEI